MNENELNINEVVKIETLPKIFYQLEKVGTYIEDNLKDIDSLECTEENKKEVKNRRTAINNTLKEFENKRKDIKNSILESYTLFEGKYSKEVKTRLESASNRLTEKINVIEETQKQKKRDLMIEFFNQYQEFYHLEDIIKFEDVGLNITLSATETSLKNQIVEFCKKISEDLVAISSDDNRDELLLEYKNNGFDYTKAVISLKEKQKHLEEIKNKMDNLNQVVEEENKIIETVNEVIAPIEIEEEKLLTCTFTVKTTKDKLIQLRNFMKEKEIEYSGK